MILHFFFRYFYHLSPSLIDISTAKCPCNNIDKTRTFTAFTPHVTVFTILEAIRKSQDSMAHEVLGDFVAELRNRGKIGSFSAKRMQSLLEVMCNKVEFDLKNLLKATSRLEESPD